MFWFRKPAKKKKPILFIMASVLSFSMMYFAFWLVNDIMHFSDKDISSQLNLGKRVSRVVDGNISNFLSSVDKVRQTYLSGGDLSQVKSNLDSIMDFLSTNKDLINKLPEKYRPFAFFLSNLAWYKSQIYDILWFSEKKIYMFVLENTSEARPNGGFFWSYAIVQVYKWKIEEYKVFDAYYPQYINSWAKVTLEPSYADIFNAQNGIWFISSNVYWFTDLDGGNIKLLYEKTFPWQRLDGVVFLQSDLVEKILPGISDKLITRQFLNANVDQIAKDDPLNKKEFYIKDIQSYIASNLNQIILYSLQNFDLITKENGLNFYLPRIDKEFKSFLIKHNLINTFNPNKIYVRDFNLAYNKIDRFVSKRWILQDSKWRVISDGDGDILDAPTEKWVYDLYLFYNINVPDSYIQKIQSLVSYYGIWLTAREIHILWLSYNRSNRVIIWMWDHIQAGSVEWWVPSSTGSTDFGTEDSIFWVRDLRYADLNYANVATFTLGSIWNNIFKVVKIQLLVD